MIFSLPHLIDSLAGVLKARYPQYPVYASANQQGTRFPCFFLFFMPSETADEIGGRMLRDLGVDIVFVQQRNPVNGNMELHQIAEYLDEAVPLFDYSDGNEKGKLHTFERQWLIEDGELHYKLHIRPRVSLPTEIHFMEEMEGNYGRIRKEKR